MSLNRDNLLRLWRSPLLESLPGIVHGVTERGGGASDAPYASLNLGLHVGDSAEAVRENRRRVAEAAYLPYSQMVCAAQVHGAEVAVVTSDDAGRGALDADDALPGVDSLVAAQTELLLTLFFADCLPILLADPVRRVVAVAHAGWRGAVGGVIENTLQAMTAKFGTRPADVVAAIGPGIGPCCFAVGPDVAARFEEDRIIRDDSGQLYADLPREARHRLLTAGVRESQIDVCGECTACNTDRYFSHRRENGNTGRIAAFIALRD